MKRKYNWLNHFFNFIAVILGVYLAFIINERAESKKDRKECSELMSSLVSDLSEDLKVYEDYQIPENVRHLENISSMIAVMNTDNLEAINRQLPNLFQVENYAPTTATYSSMKSSGKLGLIEDLSLQKELADYYEGLVLESIKKSDFQVDFFSDELLGWVMQNADLAEMKLLKQDELTVFRNKLIIYESVIEQKVESYKMIVQDSRQLKQKIESLL